MKRQIAFFLMVVAAAVAATGQPVKAPEQPNVVFILLDDVGEYLVSAYGAEKIGSTQGFFEDVEFETPNIDRLATEGMRFDRAYAYPLCEPTRIALMSGKNNSRNYHKPKSQHASDLTFGDMFKRAGYNTCVLGKWKQTRGTKEIPGKDYVAEFGWDEFYCFDVVTEGRRMIEPNFVLNGKIVNYEGIDPDTGRRWYGPDIINRYALDFIDRNADKPFFLYYSMVLMHDEHTPTPDTEPKSIFDNHDINNTCKWGHMKGDDRRYFPDMLAYMDKMVGQVLDKLDALNLRDNTLVVVMGDNGTKECFYHVLSDGSKVIGNKGANKEGGLHVPLLARLPGQVPAKKTYDGMVNVTDILPTLCDAAGVEVPNRDQIDGISFWPQATGAAAGEARDTIYNWYNANNESKDLENVIEYAFDKNFKRYAPSNLYPEGRFFDLRTDLFETTGDQKKKVPKVWNKWHYSGLKLDQLTDEQKAAYDRLGQVIEANKYVPVKSLEVIKGEVPFAVGQSQKLKCKVYPENATRNGVIWESSNPDVASVDKFGEVTVHKKGEVTIRVYSWDDAYPLAANAKVTYSKEGISDAKTIRIDQ